MRINDEKRRDVAQRLREVETLEYDGDVWCDEGDVLDALGLYNDDDPSSCDPNKVAFLADLIEPQERTCVNESASGKYFNCSECGAELMQITPGWVALVRGRVNYCPNCGARVVDEEGNDD